MPEIKHTKDLSDLFFLRLDEVCLELGAAKADMLGVMMAESGVKAGARNPHTNASGLIQFMPSTLKGLGYVAGDEEFRKIAAHEQLPWVRRYFIPHKGILTDIGRVYCAVFLPALLRHIDGDGYVLAAKNGRLGWAYSANTVFDANNDETITLAELKQAVLRNCRGERWAEIMARAGLSAPAHAPVMDFDLSTTLGLQKALKRLGYSPGPTDGVPGPLTRMALMQFQTAKGLVVDAIPGPITRGAMLAALRGA